MANRVNYAPSHGGGFSGNQPTLIVIHSLEAPARRGLAWDLAAGWLKNAGVSPHAMTDPGETVETCPENVVGWHCGNGNQYGIGLEVVGYAAYTLDQWTTGDQWAALRLDAKRCAEAASRHGIPLRWLSLQQIRNGEKGICTHADITLAKGGTTHTDPGKNFPFEAFMRTAIQFQGGSGDNAGGNPNPKPEGGSGGSEVGDEDVMRLVSNNGYVFAMAPGRFYHVENSDHLALGQATGLYVGDIKAVEGWHLDVLRDVCLGNGSDKDMNIVDKLPSDVAQGKA